MSDFDESYMSYNDAYISIINIHTVIDASGLIKFTPEILNLSCLIELSLLFVSTIHKHILIIYEYYDL